MIIDVLYSTANNVLTVYTGFSVGDSCSQKSIWSPMLTSKHISMTFSIGCYHIYS